MIKVKFKNLEKSDALKDVVLSRVGSLVSKFKLLEKSNIQVTLEMENSPQQAGLDQFNVKIQIQSGKYAGVIVEKSHSNAYSALADAIDHMLEGLNRQGDKMRVKEIKSARKSAKKLEKDLSLSPPS